MRRDTHQVQNTHQAQASPRLAFRASALSSPSALRVALLVRRRWPNIVSPCLPDKDRLRQAEEERRQAEEETARQEKEQTDKLEEEQVSKTKDTVLAATELVTSAHQTPLPTEVARSSKPPALRPDTMVAVKPAKPSSLRRFVLLGLIGLVIVALASGIVWFTSHHASLAGSVSEFPVPTANSSPGAITAGPDGNLWFTDSKSNKIGRISPSGTITEFPTPTARSSPNGITAGPDGNLWFTEYVGNKIGRITSGK